jgi:molybdate transport system ATP-binding protein
LCTGAVRRGDRCLGSEQMRQRGTILASYPHEHRLTVEIRKRIGSLDVDVSFQLNQPWTILFGPSGSGKTTILRAIAGLTRPDVGRIVLYPKDVSGTPDGDVLVDTETGLQLPSHRRQMRMAPQAVSLFPHLTVLQNVRYGMLAARNKEQDKEVNAAALKALALFRIEHLAAQRPAELSGGEAQRVNLARAAAATECKLLMLDEPFSGLDMKLRDELILSLRERQEQRRIPVLSVTHDVAEAFQLRAEVIKIAEGKVVAQGPVEVVLAEERERLLTQLGNPTPQTRDVGHSI